MRKLVHLSDQANDILPVFRSRRRQNTHRYLRPPIFPRRKCLAKTFMRRGHRALPACHRETTQSCEGQRFHSVTNRVHLTCTPGSVGAPGSNPWSDPAREAGDPAKPGLARPSKLVRVTAAGLGLTAELSPLCPAEQPTPHPRQSRSSTQRQTLP